MPFSFECGVCHSVYRLDESQISSSGVKITCPRCLNYFLLKPDDHAAESPLVEHIVQDGAYEIVVPPPKPGELTVDRLLTDADLSDGEAVAPPPSVTAADSRLKRPPPPKEEKTVVEDSDRENDFAESFPTQITQADLLDYPPDQPPQGRIDQYLVPISLILLAAGALLLLNYYGTIPIPGLDRFRMAEQKVEAEVPTPPASPTTAATPSRPPKYGFPVVEQIPEAPKAPPTDSAEPTEPPAPEENTE